jgi:hypothetical protein
MPSSSGQELMAKVDPITNDRIAGVYEKTGEVSALYQSQGNSYRVTNHWVFRIELRQQKLVTAFKCVLSYNEPGRPEKTLLPFVQQPAEATDQYFQVLAAGEKTETDVLSQMECTIDQPATTWAFCEESTRGSEIFTKIPDGANKCIGRWDQNLQLVEVQYDHGESLGVKVAN